MNAGSPPTLAVFGEVLVEIMRPEVGMPLSKPGVFRGPFASGAPAIAASAAANLGAAVTFAGVVGDDPFGQLCIDTMRGYGVDVAGVHVDASRTTGMAFVAWYRYLNHSVNALCHGVPRAMNTDTVVLNRQVSS